MSGSSRISVDGYTGYSNDERPHDTEQFDVSDQHSLDDVVCWLMENGHILSFCTACYCEGRTSDRFMSLRRRFCLSVAQTGCFYGNYII